MSITLAYIEKHKNANNTVGLAEGLATYATVFPTTSKWDLHEILNCLDG